MGDPRQMGRTRNLKKNEFSFSHVIIAILLLAVLATTVEYFSRTRGISSQQLFLSTYAKNGDTEPKGLDSASLNPKDDLNSFEQTESIPEEFETIPEVLETVPKHLVLKSKQRQIESCPCNSTADYLYSCSERKRSSNLIRRLKEADKIFQRNLDRRKLYLQNPEPNLPLSMSLPEILTCPLYPCFGELRLGDWEFGGKWVCLMKKFQTIPIVCSIGSFDDTLFLHSMHKITKSISYVFDLSNSRINLSNLEHIQIIRLKKKSKKNEHDDKKIYDFSSMEEEEFEIFESKKLQLVKSIIRAMKKIETLGRNTRIDFLILYHDLYSFSAISKLFLVWKVENYPKQLLFQVCSAFKLDREKSIFQKLEDLGYYLFRSEKLYLELPCVELSYIHTSQISHSV